uniref:Uncharacterized protein n=1 Tax=Arundo donax TaxID=35708 RepID=A0A0A9CHA3_ARUDO
MLKHPEFYFISCVSCCLLFS